MIGQAVPGPVRDCPFVLNRQSCALLRVAPRLLDRMERSSAVGAGSRGSDVSAQQPVAPSGAARSFTVQDGRAGARRWVRSCYGLALGGCLDRIGRPGRTARDVGKWIVMAAA